MLGSQERQAVVEELYLAHLQPGMVFVQDVRTLSGILLISRGHEVTASLLERIDNVSRNSGVKEPVRVMIPAGAQAYRGVTDSLRAISRQAASCPDIPDRTRWPWSSSTPGPRCRSRLMGSTSAASAPPTCTAVGHVQAARRGARGVWWWATASTML